MRDTSVILLIENDKEYIYLLEHAFRRSHIPNPLKIARYGNEAILYLKGVGIYGDRRTYPLPAVILLDMTNPDGASMAVLGWIREQKHFRDMPVLILVREENRDLQNALDRGANAFLVKREDLHELVALVKSLDLTTERTPTPSQKQDTDESVIS